MKISVLREFLYLSEELNYSATARHFFINQSALSRHIMDLEAELGCSLFVRSGKSVRLTRAGKYLTDHAPELIGLHDKIAAETGKAGLQQDRCLSVGYLQGAAAPYLMAGKKLFKRDHPEIQVNVKSMQPAEIEEALRKDTLDVGITMLPKGTTSNSYNYITLYEDTFALMMDPQNPLGATTSVTPSQLRKPIYIADSFPHEPRLAAFVKEQLSNAGIQYEISENIDDVESMPMLFERKDWVCMSCMHLGRIFGQKFRFIPIEGLDLNFDVIVIWKKSHHNVILQDFVDCVSYGYEIIGKS